jgi:hypothetical protein
MDPTVSAAAVAAIVVRMRGKYAGGVPGGSLGSVEFSSNQPAHGPQRLSSTARSASST